MMFARKKILDFQRTLTMQSALDPKVMLARVDAAIADMEARPPQLRTRCAALLAALYAQREQLSAGTRPAARTTH
jgi:hypothetical protein